MTDAARPDRYVTFNGLDCDGRTRVVMAAIEELAASSTSPFWAYFETQRRIAHGRGLDDLRVLHNFLPTLKELLENEGAGEVLAMLEQLEVICM